MGILISISPLAVFASSIDGVWPPGVQPTQAGRIQGTGLLDKLILQDIPPWGTSSNELAIADNGYSYTIVSTATFPTTNLSPYKVIILAGSQKAAYYVAISSDPIKSILSNFVYNGGVLIAHMVSMWEPLPTINLPGAPGLVPVFNPIEDVSVADPSHPIINGPWGWVTDTNIDNWLWSSHGYFTNLPSNAIIIMVEGPTAPNPGAPTYAQWSYGYGIVIATRSPLEWGYGYVGGDGMTPLRNEIAFAQSHSPVGGELVAQSALPLSNLIAVAIVAVAFIGAGVTVRRRLKA